MKNRRNAGLMAILLLFILSSCMNGGKAAMEDGGSFDIFDSEQYKDMFSVLYFKVPHETRSGDAIVVRTPDGATMMIDFGIPESGEALVELLDELGIDTIDIALNTHPHHDHLGGLIAISEAKEIKQYYHTGIGYSSPTYSSAYRNLRAKEVPIHILRRGDTFKLGEEVTAEVFNPAPGPLTASSTADHNNHSIVVKLTYKNQSFLFNGDIYLAKEAELIELFGDQLEADFMHAPHHGSPVSSSSNMFIQAVNPRVAVASYNIFSFIDTMKKYDRHEVEFYATGLDGHILILSDGEEMNVIAEHLWEAPPELGLNLR